MYPNVAHPRRGMICTPPAKRSLVRRKNEREKTPLGWTMLLTRRKVGKPPSRIAIELFFGLCNALLSGSVAGCTLKKHPPPMYKSWECGKV